MAEDVNDGGLTAAAVDMIVSVRAATSAAIAAIEEAASRSIKELADVNVDDLAGTIERLAAANAAFEELGFPSPKYRSLVERLAADGRIAIVLEILDELNERAELAAVHLSPGMRA